MEDILRQSAAPKTGVAGAHDHADTPCSAIKWSSPDIATRAAFTG
jgi:hypothetical protein